MFGAPQQQQQPQTGGFSFGATSQPATQSTGFSFGATSQPAASTTTSNFSFGGNTATSNTNTGFSFNSSTSTAPASSGGFSFGGAKPATSTTGGFGFNTQTPSSGGFNTQASSTGGFGFGNQGSSFGATNQQANTNSGFGGFGTTPTNTFGQNPQNANAAPQGPTPVVPNADASISQLNAIKFAYQDPTQSRFKFLLYNPVEPSQRHLYTRPAHISEVQWDQAEVDNPDPNTFAPTPVVGLEQLLKRVGKQQEFAGQYDKFTNDLKEQLAEMDKKSRASDEKLERCRHEHTQLVHHLIKIMKDIEFLQHLGKPLQQDEVNLASALKKLQTLLDAPDQYKARLNQAVAKQQSEEEAPSSEPPALNSDQQQRIYEFLEKQRQGLEALTTVLNDDLADIKLMKESLKR